MMTHESNALPEIKNYMEYFVQEAIDQALPGMNTCMCERCRFDIAAMALNSLPPKYVVTRKGELYTKLDTMQQQFTIDVITAITNAATLVSKNPRHE